MKALKKISALKMRQNLGRVMNEVALRGDDYIVERSGKPLVAIIPLGKYWQLQEALDDFFDEVKDFRTTAKKAKSKDVDQAIAEAVEAAKKAELKQLSRQNS
jgi:prevent-host-death family protein